jgi:hypothetical protein
MKQVAKLFMQTCPGEWDFPWNHGVRHTLRMVRDGTVDTTYVTFDTAAMMKFRLGAARLADTIVEVARLKQSAGQICIMWDWQKWDSDAKQRIPNLRTRQVSIRDTLENAGVVTKPLRAQGPPFPQFDQYLTASILEMDPSEEEILEKCQAVIEVIHKRLEIFGHGVL